MKRICTGPVAAIVLACLATGTAAARAAPAEVEDGFFGAGHWRMALSPFSVHFSPNPEHKPVLAIALDWQRDDAWLWGGSFFSNSFGQPSAYLYLGQRHAELFGEPRLFVQWTAGMMYGYRGKYQEKVPFNSNGFSPGFIPSLGWSLDDRSSIQVNMLGTAGLMLQISYEMH